MYLLSKQAVNSQNRDRIYTYFYNKKTLTQILVCRVDEQRKDSTEKGEDYLENDHTQIGPQGQHVFGRMLQYGGQLLTLSALKTDSNNKWKKISSLR